MKYNVVRTTIFRSPRQKIFYTFMCFGEGIMFLPWGIISLVHSSNFHISKIFQMPCGVIQKTK